MSKIDQIEEALNVLKDIESLKRERVDLIAENDLKRDASAKLEKAEQAAEAANRHAKRVVEEAQMKAADIMAKAQSDAANLTDSAQASADELIENAKVSSQALINGTRAQLAAERDGIDSAHLERGVLESEVKALQAKHDDLTALIAGLKAQLAGAVSGL